MSYDLNSFITEVKTNNPGEIEFHQAVEEVTSSLIPILNKHFPKYKDQKILERLIEPERQIIFRIPWMNDNSEIEVNRGFRVEFNSAIGPYKGGLRFHPSVKIGTLKFLGFEQIFKNSLTSLPLGGGKGGADFNPKGKSDNEVMKFCQSFMNELYRHIGDHTDIPAGDIGVGTREIGYMFGQYKKLQNRFEGVLTGKGTDWGGSHIRTEATGYGLVYLTNRMMETNGIDYEGKKILVSGAGNVAQFAIEKSIELGGIVITVSDSNGFVHVPNGISSEMLENIKYIKNIDRGNISEFADKYDLEYFEGEKPWNVRADVALPCATQNEIIGEDAKALLENKCKVIAEGSNMSSNIDAINIFAENDVLFAPAKAANAGGVAVSGLEMAQNSGRVYWSRDKVDSYLKNIMIDIQDNVAYHAEKYSKKKNYIDGANIAGFIKVADSMIAQGIV